MKNIKLNINTKTQNYPIIIGTNLTKKITSVLDNNSIIFKNCLLIIDKKVPKFKISEIKKSLKKKNIYTFFLNASENNKNIKIVNKILEVLLKRNFSRDDCLISIGGGITGDISGFAASQFKRGLKFINIPTTLLAQVDSAIGGKTGVNTKYGKNLIGSFYQPNLVISDTEFLKTLPKREIVCGYGEILKHSLIANRKFYIFLKKNYEKIFNLSPQFINKSIYESCKIKKKIVEKDEKESGLRKILNFGHTFAHAYESSLNFSKKLNHGEAVILGIHTALNFCFQNRLIKTKDYNSIIRHIKNSKLPSSLNKFFKKKDAHKIVSFMLSDKKNKSDKINLIVLKRIGLPVINKEYKKNKILKFLKDELNN